MFLRHIGFTVLCTLLIIAKSANAAVIGLDYNPDGTTSVRLNGEIVDGDYKEVVKWSAYCLTANSTINIQLNTPGGSAIEAMKIGRFLRATFGHVNITGRFPRAILGVVNVPGRGFVSAGDEDIQCYSSGVLILVGAPSRKFGMDNYILDPEGNSLPARSGDYSSDGRRVNPVVGLHRPYFAPEIFSTLSGAQAQSLYTTMKSTVSDYMLEMGASQELAERMFRTASDDLDLIIGEKLEEHLSKLEPFLDEWLGSKCDYLTGEEFDDFNTSFSASENFSDGYIKYLREKDASAWECGKALVIRHQRKVIQLYLKELGLDTLPELEEMFREMSKSIDKQ